MANSEQAAAVDPHELETALARAWAEPVVVRETHISWVFQVGERAFKLKKPLVLPFVDYRTPARRRAMCENEVRLNRRLAPDGVRSSRAGAHEHACGDAGGASS